MIILDFKFENGEAQQHFSLSYWLLSHRQSSMYYGTRMPLSNGSRYNKTYKFMRKVVYSTWLLIEPCYSHRLSEGATTLFSIVVFFLSIFLIHHAFTAFFLATAFISIGFLFSFCDDDEFFNPGKVQELWAICKYVNLYFTDIHILFFGQN